MKKLLLGTTAIVGASFMATAAMAKPEVRLGGFMNFQVGIVTQDHEGFGPSPGGVTATANERGYDFLTDNEIIIRVSDKLDNGLAWSLKIELEANTDDGQVAEDASTADEVTLTFSGSWGQLFFGSDDGPADTMKTGAKRAVSDAGTGGVGGDWRRWVNYTTASTRVWTNAEDVRDTSDATKIAYITPRFAGFQAGVSFSPDRDTDGRYRDPDNNGTEQSWWELGINYDQKFDQFRIRASLTGDLADNENTARNDTRNWYAGTTLSFGGFSLGGGYGRENERGLAKTTSNGDISGWDVGLGYEMGAWNFGLSYYRTKGGVPNGSGDHKLSVAALGATYDLGNGLSIYAEGVWFNADSATNTTTSFDNEGYALITGIGVEF